MSLPRGHRRWRAEQRPRPCWCSELNTCCFSPLPVPVPVPVEKGQRSSAGRSPSLPDPRRWSLNPWGRERAVGHRGPLGEPPAGQAPAGFSRLRAGQLPGPRRWARLELPQACCSAWASARVSAGPGQLRRGPAPSLLHPPHPTSPDPPRVTGRILPSRPQELGPPPACLARPLPLGEPSGSAVLLVKVGSTESSARAWSDPAPPRATGPELSSVSLTTDPSATRSEGFFPRPRLPILAAPPPFLSPGSSQEPLPSKLGGMRRTARQRGAPPAQCRGDRPGGPFEPPVGPGCVVPSPQTDQTPRLPAPGLSGCSCTWSLLPPAPRVVPLQRPWGQK